MEQRPIRDRTAEIGRPAGPRPELAVNAGDLAVLVKADVVIDDEIVALAGDREIVVAVGTELDRPPELFGGQRRNYGEEIPLGLLAAEPATHAPDRNRHRVGRHAESVADHVLDFARMLGRGEERDVVVLARNGQGDLAFEIEMLLPADGHAAAEPVLGARKRRFGIAALEHQRLGDQFATRRHGRFGVEHRRKVGIFDPGQRRRPPRLLARFGDNREQGLPPEQADAIGENRLVADSGRGDVVVSGDVVIGQNRDNARRGAHRIEIQRRNRRVGALGQPEIGMKTARGHRHVIDIFRRAGNVLVAAVVRHRLMHAHDARASRSVASR